MSQVSAYSFVFLNVICQLPVSLPVFVNTLSLGSSHSLVFVYCLWSLGKGRVEWPEQSWVYLLFAFQWKRFANSHLRRLSLGPDLEKQCRGRQWLVLSPSACLIKEPLSMCLFHSTLRGKADTAIIVKQSWGRPCASAHHSADAACRSTPSTSVA